MSTADERWEADCDRRAEAEELRRDEIEWAHEDAAPVEPDPPILCDWHEGVVRDLHADADVAAALARSCDDCEAAE